MTQERIGKQILPMQLDADNDDLSGAGEYLYSPNGQEILADLLPRSLRSPFRFNLSWILKLGNKQLECRLWTMQQTMRVK